jgi:hypothetical protein
MSESFIPADDAGCLDWMIAFSAGISANPALYMLSSTDAASISAAVQAFADARAITVAPSTRTSVAIENKDNSRVSAEQICRQYAALIKPNSAISDGSKTAIGVPPPNTTREPIEPPSTSPILNVIAATPGAQTLRYSDSMTPDSRAKPPGATDLLLFLAVGDAIATDPSEATFIGKFTKNPIAVPFDAADNRKQATYFGRWSNRKGQVGPWSAPATLAIAA